MTVHYQEFAVPVDPEFARDLKAQLDARRVRQHRSPNPSPADDEAIQLPRITEVTLALTPAKQPDHKRRRVGLLAAAVVAVLVAGTVLVLTRSDDDAGLRPADTLPPASAPLADRQFAGAVALTPADWGANYTFGRAGGRFGMPRELAETLPECEPFLDAVFESPRRPATVTTATAASDASVGPVHWQYVVVFPDVAGAEAMMDALHDPRYPKCDARYRSKFYESASIAASGDGVPPRRDLPGDDSVVVNTLPFVRSGRTVMTFGSSYADDELVAIVARAVERVEAADAGAPLPSASLPLEYLSKAAWPSESELGARWSHSPAGEWKLDRSLGLLVPSCAAFLDLFLSDEIHPGWGEDHDPSLSLAYDSTSYATAPQLAASGGVFRFMAISYARQQDAEEAMDAISDPDFSRCLADYTSAEPPNAVWQAKTREPISVSTLSPPLGDENVQMLFDGSYTGLDGTTTPAGRMVDVFIRVDQVLIGVEVTLDHMSTDQFQSVLQQMVDRVKAAILGAPIQP